MTTSIKTLHLEYYDEQTVAVITLNDPEHGNAMSPEMGDAFSSAIREIQANCAVRAAIILGAGKDFSIGGHRDMLIKLGSGQMGEAQLREFMLLDGYGLKRASFNWRVRRLVEGGLLIRDCARPITSSPIYWITLAGALMLAVAPAAFSQSRFRIGE